MRMYCNPDEQWSDDFNESDCTDTHSVNGLCPCCGDQLETDEVWDSLNDITECVDTCVSCGWGSDPYYV